MVIDNKKVVPDEPVLIRFRGAYDYDGLLSVIRSFYKKSLFQLKETKFKFNNSPSGAEVEFKFESQRKITEYIAVFLGIQGHFWDVKRDAKGNTSGKLEITLQAKVILDYAEKFEYDDKKKEKKDGFLHKWMQKTLDARGSGIQYGDNKMIGEKYAEKLVQQLQFEIKKHLNMECV